MTFWEFVDKHLDKVDFKHVIGLIVTCWIMYIFSKVVFDTLHDNPDRYISQVITALSNIITMVLGFWFIASAKNRDLKSPDTTTITTTKTESIVVDPANTPTT